MSSIYPPVLPSQPYNVEYGRAWELTLAGTMDEISSTNSGGVPVTLQIVGAKSFVGVLLH